MDKNLFIKRFTIENFKSISHLDSSKFGQINLITGMNNSGKTTFLEALFLNLGPTNPTLWTNISARRGLNGISVEQNPAQYLFHNLDISTPIKFNVTTRSYGNYSFTISIREPLIDEINSTLEQQEKESENPPISLIRTEDSKVVEQTIKLENGETRTTKTIIHPSGIFFRGDRTSIFPQSVYISSYHSISGESDINRYDKINKSNLLDTYEDLLRIIEPNLKRTSIGLQNKEPSIHADVGYGLVPLSTLGSGIQRLGTIFLALTYAENAVVLIDEIENSFHYSVLGRVWRGLIDFSNKYNVQLFATTHSSDCIKSAYKVSKETNVKLSFHRLAITEGIRSFHTLSDEQANSLLSEDWDLR
jgi:AAA15 family ATPase/GTPase